MYIFFALLAVWAVFDIYRGWRREKPDNRSRYLGKSFLGIAAVMTALFLFGPFFMVSPLKLGYASLSDRGVVVYYPSAHQEKAREILAMAQWALDQNDKFYRKETKTKVLVAISDLDMLRFGVYPKGNGDGIPWGRWITTISCRNCAKNCSQEADTGGISPSGRVSGETSLGFTRRFMA